MASESSYSLGCGTGSWFSWSGVEKLCWRGRALSLSSCGWAGWAAAANEDLLACCPWLLGQGQSPPLAGSSVYSLFRIPLTTQGSSDPVVLFSVIPTKTCVTLSDVLGVGGWFEVFQQHPAMVGSCLFMAAINPHPAQQTEHPEPFSPGCSNSLLQKAAARMHRLSQMLNLPNWVCSCPTEECEPLAISCSTGVRAVQT